jgi:hypothetical protein
MRRFASGGEEGAEFAGGLIVLVGRAKAECAIQLNVFFCRLSVFAVAPQGNWSAQFFAVNKPYMKGLQT